MSSFTLDLAQILTVQSWTKVLGTVLQYLYFSVCSIYIFRFPLKTVHPFQNFLAVLPPPHPIQSWNSEKILDTRVQHCLWGEGRGWTCWNGKLPRKAKVSLDFCPWLSEKEVGRKKAAVLRVFQTSKSVFFGILMKNHKWTNVFPAFRSFLNVF